MIISIEGEEATAKTTIAYTSPLPIVGFSFDIGSKRALYGTKYSEWFEGLRIAVHRRKVEDSPADSRLWKVNDITILEMPQPIQLESVAIKGFLELWTYFINSLFNAIEDESIKTIVIDTMTLARRYKADAYLQELQESGKMRKQLQQIEYGHVNDSIRNIYNTMGTLDRNFVAVHHLTDERSEVVRDGQVQQVLTGERVLEGLAQTYRYVDVALRMKKDSRNKAISADIVKCGYNLSLEKTIVPDPDWNKLVDMVEMSLGGRLKFDRRNSSVSD